MSLRQEGAIWSGQLDVLLVLRGSSGEEFDSTRETLGVMVTSETYRRLLQDGLVRHLGLKANTRTVALQVIVCDGASGNLGSVTIPIDVTRRYSRGSQSWNWFVVRAVLFTRKIAHQWLDPLRGRRTLHDYAAPQALHCGSLSVAGLAGAQTSFTPRDASGRVAVRDEPVAAPASQVLPHGLAGRLQLRRRRCGIRQVLETGHRPLDLATSARGAVRIANRPAEILYSGMRPGASACGRSM